MDIQATQYWLNTLFTSPFNFHSLSHGSDEGGTDEGGTSDEGGTDEDATIGTNADGVVVTAGLAEKDLGLVTGAQVWGMTQKEVRVELFSLELSADELAELFTLDLTGLQPGARLHGYVFTAPTLWEAGLPQLTEDDRITTLLSVGRGR
ncbi:MULTISPECIES: hypothetical protein [Corynebacterium]|uniref:hypothetical protein n=1 Tax=Corynebacterium TaxID=1716 RepID=UPI0008A2A1E4|nr:MULTISPECIES: hypothetical protein [Corynebacterium]MCT1563397.1 hypothetical protein [Corynebacterium glucuronolyticum]OFO47666.1 hypothetical protein HMPREF3044_09865 [Corynebacterium sp. HMSC073D01]